MKRASLIIVAFALCVTLGTVGVTYALENSKKAVVAPSDSQSEITEDEKEPSKDETVYVLAGADGSVKKIIVSEWIKNTLSKSKISDRTELTDIENVKGDEKYTIDSSKMAVWDAEGNDIYYQGNINKELPVNLKVSYKLNGKDISAEKIAGKSGKVTIRFDYENCQFETVKIDGSDEIIYVPFAMLTGMLLDSNSFRNIEVSNGKLINDGDRTAVIGFALPGLQNNLGKAAENLDIPDYVEITADVTDFRFGMTVTIATNELFNQIDASKFNSIEDITKNITELTDGMGQLLDGSSKLYDGLATLLDKSKELASGIEKMASGAKTLKDGAIKLDSGVSDLKGGISDLSSGLNQLTANNKALTGGAKQVFETLLSTAAAQITSGGISVPTLTIDNYAEVLGGIISSLDETSVYNAALSQVTAAVETNRAVIEEKVTAAVREQVAEQVVPIATSGKMTRESYEAAKTAKMIDDASVIAIESAINAQMQSDTVKNTVSQQVELQIQKAISDNMASPDVQNKLAAASDGAKSIIALKTSLDSYSTFYNGLLSYTEGVASAAGGAEKLNNGAANLKTGSSQLKDGISDLYDGILTMKNSTPQLTSGVSQLKDGAMQLSGGLNRLNDEGISKISELVDGDIKGLAARIKATLDISKNYRNFAGISDSMGGKVKFIYRTDEIK